MALSNGLPDIKCKILDILLVDQCGFMFDLFRLLSNNHFSFLKMQEFYSVEYFNFSSGYFIFAKIRLRKPCSLTLPSACFTFVVPMPHLFF